jgi:hypothetical protein
VNSEPIAVQECAMANRDAVPGPRCPLFLVLHTWIGALALSVVVYHTAIISNLTAHTASILFVVLAAASGITFMLINRNRPTSLGVPPAAVAALLGLMALAVTFVSVVSRPDADDAQFFHRALVQLERKDQPFIVSDQLLDIPDLPQSAVGVVASYELAIALAANAVGIDPVQAYHNISPVVSTTMWVLVTFLLCVEFGLDWKRATVAVLGAFVFLVLDGDLHRSFGNFSLIRIWHGKAVLCSVLVPATLLSTVRFVRSPSIGRWVLVLSCCVASFSLSGSGLFLGPATIAAAGISGLAISTSLRPSLLAYASLIPAVLYPGVILSLMVFGVLDNHDVSHHYSSWPSAWTDNVGLVFGGWASWIFVAVVLSIGPWLSMGWSRAKAIIVYSAAVAVFFVNPVIGPLWLQEITPGAYWRLLYLFPIPLCFGILASSAVFKPLGLPSNFAVRARVALVLIVVVYVAGSRYTVVSPPPGGAPVFLKAPWGLRLEPQAREFVDSLPTSIDSSSVLAPRALVPALALLRPDARLYCARAAQTQRRFNILNDPEIGRRRVQAQRYVSQCDPGVRARNLAALERAIAEGISAVLARDCGPAGNSAMLEQLKNRAGWQMVARESGFVAWERMSPEFDH